MSEIVKIKPADIFPLIAEVISQGPSALISVKGSSMYPFLRDDIDSVEFIQGDFESLSRGDIVLALRNDGTYVMHRVFCKKENGFFLVGDAEQRTEGPFFPEQMVALVSAVWRKDKKILCSNVMWKILSQFWLLLRPGRKYILKLFRIINNSPK